MNVAAAAFPVSGMLKHVRWNVGVIGLGKLGCPVALAMSLKGHHVIGYDVNPERMQKETYREQERGPNGEASMQQALRDSDLRFGEIDEVVEKSDIIFMAIQTPHDPRYEGVTRLPDERIDFDYSYLKEACARLFSAINFYGQEKIVVIISTVLPGTLRREIMPMASPLVKLCYNPFFIAMGTTINDFLHPEFVLLGVEDQDAADKVRLFYASLHDRPVRQMSIENAELTKVAYNTFISMKICFANTLMEICDKVPGCDVDEVTGALALATDRLISPKYMRGGMGDGGGCHPRDNIAMSWLARKLELSHDLFEDLMKCREHQTGYLAQAVCGVYGKSFKPETNLTVGSPATLLCNLIKEQTGQDTPHWDPKVDATPCPFTEKGVYIVATQHAEFARPDYPFPAGSVVIDPFRYLPKRDDITVIPVGKCERT